MARPRGEKPPPPTHGIRVEDELWADAQRVAKDKGTSLNREIVRFLRRYVANHPLDPPDDR